ncbi:MAG: glycosyltransferase family 4 protein [Candidatus Hydrogenedentes bacterium]|nr:glycosyltransferase family 4 protein [Candidatus Hydrogenedentota bacterium]
MRICILNVLHSLDDKRVFYKEALSLVGAGHEVISVVPSDDQDLPSSLEGVELVRIPVARSLPARLRSTLRLISIGRRQPVDCYLCVEPESWVAGLAIKLLTGRKVVFDVHEYIPTEFAKFFPRFLRSLIAWSTIRAMRLMARVTDHIILTKNCLDKEFEGLAVPRTVVLNTNHLQQPTADIPDSLLETYGSKPTIIHQGVFGDVRGSFQLLDAMVILKDRIPDIRCIILGDYVYGDVEKFRQGIREKGLGEHMHLLGVVPFHEVPAYVAVSKAGLILFQPIGLAHTYGMPHKMFDYMREGVPMIAPDFAVEIKLIVEEGPCGLLIDVTDPEAIAEAIQRLLEDKELAERLGANGRKAVEQKYNWQAEEKKLLSVFEALT